MPLVLDQADHVLQGVLVDPTDDLVERVVDGALTLGFAVPLSQSVVHVLAVALHSHVDDGGDATPGRRARAGLEGVGREGATEGQFHVGVNVDATGQHELALGVDDLVTTLLGAGEVTRCTDGGDLLALDEHVVLVHSGRRDHLSVLDQYLGHYPSRWFRVPVGRFRLSGVRGCRTRCLPQSATRSSYASGRRSR